MDGPQRLVDGVSAPEFAPKRLVSGAPGVVRPAKPLARVPRFAEEGSDEEEDSDECAASTPQPTAAEMAQRAGATVIDLEAEMAKHPLSAEDEDALSAERACLEARRANAERARLTPTLAVSKATAAQWVATSARDADAAGARQAAVAERRAREELRTADLLAAERVRRDTEKALTEGDVGAISRLALAAASKGKDLEAIALWEHGARLHHAGSTHNLACARAEGLGGRARDLVEAARLFRLAADAGLADAQCALGELYCDGAAGLERDDAQALSFLQAAASQGHPEAQFKLGVCYFNGAPPAPQADWALAASYFRKSADSGLPDAAYNLGVMLGTGRGVPANRDEALRLLLFAAKEGHPQAAHALREVQGQV